MIEFSGRMSRVFLKKIQLFFIFFEKTGLNQHPLHLVNTLLTNEDEKIFVDPSFTGEQHENFSPKTSSEGLFRHSSKKFSQKMALVTQNWLREDRFRGHFAQFQTK